MTRVAHRLTVVTLVVGVMLSVAACGGLPLAPDESVTPTPGGPGSDQPDSVAGFTSYQLTGGDARYQFSGVLCSVDGGEIPPVGSAVTGGANMAPSIGVFSWNWVYGDDEIDSATGEITDLQVTEDSIQITATYSGYVSIGDGGTNTPISGEMTFEGVPTETPASCLG